MITMATWEESLQPQYQSTQYPVTLATPTLQHNNGNMVSVWCCFICQHLCVCVDALPLRPLVQAGAPSTKWTLFVTIIEWQQGVWTQTLKTEKGTILSRKVQNLQKLKTTQDLQQLRNNELRVFWKVFECESEFDIKHIYLRCKKTGQTFVMYWTKSLRKGSLQRMNHMAITWWARDTMYWLNLMVMG